MNKRQDQSKEPFIKQLESIQELSELKGHYPDRLIASFLEKEEHKTLLAYTLAHPSAQQITQLDQAFKEHYAEIKFIKYISMILHYESIHYNQKRSHREQQVTFFDPNEETLEHHFGESLGQEEQRLELNQTSLEEQITDHNLYEAFQNLTPRQQKILQLSYAEHLTDREIATHFKVSQQAISGSRLAALKKLRSVIETQPGSTSNNKKKEAQADG